MFEDIRREIDLIDENIARLISRRFELTNKIGEIKRQNKIEVYDENREKAIIENVIKNVKTEEEKNILKEIYMNILKVSKNSQLK